MAAMRVLSRITSVILGVFCALAGVVALGYALDGIETLKFFKGNLLGGLVGILVPGVLCASAFYMAVRLIKRQPEKQPDCTTHSTVGFPSEQGRK